MTRTLTRYAIAKSPRSRELLGGDLVELMPQRRVAETELAAVRKFRGWSRAVVVRVTVTLEWVVLVPPARRRKGAKR